MKAIIVDDESRARENLRLLLTDYCGVQVVAEAASAKEALELLEEYKPDVFFLDIQMPGMDGLQLAGQVSKSGVPVVFVTAHDQYALQALKASAVDYLLKPTTIKELKAAVEKVNSQTKVRHQEDSIDVLQSNLNSSQHLERLMVPWEGGFKVIELSTVQRIESDNTYSELYLESERVVVSKSIGELELLLQDSGFYRVHYRHMINLAYLDMFSNKDGGTVKMKNGTVVPIARRRLAGFKEAAQAYFNSKR